MQSFYIKELFSRRVPVHTQFQHECKIVDDAIKNKCQKVQFYEEYITKELIDKAHENGIICNVFYTDDPKRAIELLDLGVDTILTNDYLKIANVVKEYKNK